VHTGLGPLNPKTGTYANAALVNARVLAKLNPGAIVINYDRGECVDATALGQAMASGRVRYAAIDADVFRVGNKSVGPLVPYLKLAGKYPGRIELLPHAAADTDHVSRVEGAKQAVDQIIDCIRFKRVVNLKGSLPQGYTNNGAATRKGVGAVSASAITSAVANEEHWDKLRGAALELGTVCGELVQSPDNSSHATRLLHAANVLTSTLRHLGLEGPFNAV
jgi:hypothetical protein